MVVIFIILFNLIFSNTLQLLDIKIVHRKKTCSAVLWSFHFMDEYSLKLSYKIGQKKAPKYSVYS